MTVPRNLDREIAGAILDLWPGAAGVLDRKAVKDRLDHREISAPNKAAAQIGEKAGWLRALGSSRRSAYA